MAKKEASALARLLPAAIKETFDGQEIVIAGNKKENDTLNMVMAAQVRSLLRETLKAYKEKGVIPTPKELKEIAEAARNIAEFSGEVYKAADDLDSNPAVEKKVTEEKGSSIEDISFDAIKKQT